MIMFTCLLCSYWIGSYISSLLIYNFMGSIYFLGAYLVQLTTFSAGIINDSWLLIFIPVLNFTPLSFAVSVGNVLLLNLVWSHSQFGNPVHRFSIVFRTSHNLSLYYYWWIGIGVAVFIAAIFKSPRMANIFSYVVVALGETLQYPIYISPLSTDDRDLIHNYLCSEHSQPGYEPEAAVIPFHSDILCSPSRWLCMW